MTPPNPNRPVTQADLDLIDHQLNRVPDPGPQRFDFPGIVGPALLIGGLLVVLALAIVGLSTVLTTSVNMLNEVTPASKAVSP